MSDLSPHMAEWNFDEGLVGFPEWRRFRFEQTPQLGPVAQLRSFDQPDLSFFVADPRQWYDDYAVDVPPYDLERLGAADAAGLDVYTILNVQAEPFSVTVNLLGPLVVNPATGQARQIIQSGRAYQAQQPLADEVNHAGAESPR